MSFIFGKGSEVKMEGLHPNLVKVLRRAIELSETDFTVFEGVRSDEQCFINFGRGRTATQCMQGGCPAKYARPQDDKVTWLNKALSSNHRKKADGFGHAVDLYPYPIKLDLPLFDKIAKAMFEASKELAVPIRWGANWDMDKMPRERGETDNPHFELRS